MFIQYYHDGISLLMDAYAKCLGNLMTIIYLSFFDFTKKTLTVHWFLLLLGGKKGRLFAPYPLCFGETWLLWCWCASDVYVRVVIETIAAVHDGVCLFLLCTV